jgi:hypothetical protein
MNTYIPIDKNPGLYRHKSSHAVVNTDVQARNRYKLQKEKVLADKQKLDNATSEIASLKSEVADLKSLVYQLLKDKQCEQI